MSAIVTLLTDFGLRDSYVAEVKGRLLSLAAGVTIVDVSHDIPPGDVMDGAWVLARAWRAFPEGTVHVAVVDPGVGTVRRALAVESAGHRFVGPDNGLLESALTLPHAAAYALTTPRDASPTFHGRDVFAPAAAALVQGARPADLGSLVADPVRLPVPEARREAGQLVGEVIHVDRFGTLITNISGERVALHGAVRVGAYDLVAMTTFADVASGDPVALIGSAGMLEIAVRDGRADSVLGLTRGAQVRAALRRGP